MLFLCILASAHLALVVVVRVAPFATDGDRTTRIAYGVGGSGRVSPRFGLFFIELCRSTRLQSMGMRCLGEFECLLCILEFAGALLFGRFGQYGLNHIPLLQDACAGLRGIFFGLHETPRRHGELGLDGGRVECTGHGEMGAAGAM
jgi:hypothetical protein